MGRWIVRKYNVHIIDSEIITTMSVHTIVHNTVGSQTVLISKPDSQYILVLLNRVLEHVFRFCCSNAGHS